jgi:hypothetical protein
LAFFAHVSVDGFLTDGQGTVQAKNQTAAGLQHLGKKKTGRRAHSSYSVAGPQHRLSTGKTGRLFSQATKT